MSVQGFSLFVVRIGRGGVGRGGGGGGADLIMSAPRFDSNRSNKGSGGIDAICAPTTLGNNRRGHALTEPCFAKFTPESAQHQRASKVGVFSLGLAHAK